MRLSIARHQRRAHTPHRRFTRATVITRLFVSRAAPSSAGIQLGVPEGPHERSAAPMGLPAQSWSPRKRRSMAAFHPLWTFRNHASHLIDVRSLASVSAERRCSGLAGGGYRHATPQVVKNASTHSNLLPAFRPLRTAKYHQKGRLKVTISRLETFPSGIPCDSTCACVCTPGIASVSARIGLRPYLLGNFGIR